MSKLQRRAFAVLTSAALAGFTASLALAATGPGPEFRGNTDWTLENGIVRLSGAPSRDNPLYTRGALADSVSALEFRAPKGAQANLYVQGRYGVELNGTGDWQSVAIRFRAPRFDAGFSKLAHALMLEVRVGAEVRRNVRMQAFRAERVPLSGNADVRGGVGATTLGGTRRAIPAVCRGHAGL